MLKNPYINAFMASGYIALVVLIVSSTSNFPDAEQTILIPVIMLSLLVLSVATMGVLFFYQPLSLFMENKKDEALFFFLKTAGTFAGTLITLASILLYTTFFR